jgi:hypothetical protein
VPFLRRRMADFTAFDAARPYFATTHLVQLACTATTATTGPNRSRGGERLVGRR